MLLAGLLLFVATFLLLRDRETSYRVVTAAADIRAGTVVGADSFAEAEVKVGADVLSGLLQVQDAAQVEGWVAANSIAAGELVSRLDLREPAAPSDLRAMSFPIETQRAAGGDLGTGDRIDVVAVVGGVPSYVATDLEVLAVAAPGDRGALAGGAAFGLTVAVGPDEALAVAQALSIGEVTVLRSTGATVVNVLPTPTPPPPSAPAAPPPATPSAPPTPSPTATPSASPTPSRDG